MDGSFRVTTTAACKQSLAGPQLEEETAFHEPPKSQHSQYPRCRRWREMPTFEKGRRSEKQCPSRPSRAALSLGESSCPAGSTGENREELPGFESRSLN